MSEHNGFTQKELIIMVLDNQKTIVEKIDEINKQLTIRPTRMELFGWITITIAIVGALFNSMIA